MTTLTLGKNFIESGNWTTTLADEMTQECIKTFDRLLAEFDRRFTDNLPVAYSEVTKVLDIAATLPETTASNERLFSSLEIMKNYLRFTTGKDRLSYLLLIFAEND